jgi:hypothetical protein
MSLSELLESEPKDMSDVDELKNWFNHVGSCRILQNQRYIQECVSQGLIYVGSESKCKEYVSCIVGALIIIKASLGIQVKKENFTVIHGIEGSVPFIAIRN